jgi:signal transduction histidine kinase
MKKIFFILSLLLINTIQAQKIEKVSMQFHWLDQFEFAGYYVAKEKGFYRDIGLDVEFKNYKYGMNIIDEVLIGRATYAVGGSDLVLNMSKSIDIKLLFSTFQSSPLVLLTTSKHNIKSISDFKNKRIMITPDAISSVTFTAMMRKGDIKITDLKFQKHSFDINDLIKNKTDLVQSYISNEPYELKRQGIEPIIFDPKDYGFDMYSDIVFTSKYEIENHKQRAINFKEATLKGWEYAFNNIEETVNIILKKYNTQNRTKEALIYEAKELKKLAYLKNKPLGYIDISKVQRIYDAYNIMNFVDSNINVRDYILVTEFELTDEDKVFILFLFMVLVALLLFFIISNIYLKKKIEKEIQSSRKKDSIIFQQNKFVSMGEMIENIAHQWRQPLSNIANSVILIDKKLKRDLPIHKDIDDIEITLQYMSKTIYDFQNFYKPNKEKVEFNLQDIINKSISIVSGSFENSSISIDNNSFNFIIINYPNELQQVLLVILNNARDAIEDNNILNGKVWIKTTYDKKREQVNIEVSNNGGSIKEDIIDNIFEPYFTTKHKSHGTGLGLYISKMIIEKSLNGELVVENRQDSVCFNIRF